MESKNILLIGRNPNVLANLASALTAEGFAVKTTNLVEQAAGAFDAADFNLIAFGRGVDEATNAQLRADFRQQHEGIRFVDGLAPVIPLLVKQIRLALLEQPTTEKVLSEFSCQQLDRLLIRLTLTQAAQLTIDLCQLDAVHTTHQKTLVSAWIEAGSHEFRADIYSEDKLSISFLVAEVNNSELAVLPLQ